MSHSLPARFGKQHIHKVIATHEVKMTAVWGVRDNLDESQNRRRSVPLVLGQQYPASHERSHLHLGLLFAGIIPDQSFPRRLPVAYSGWTKTEKSDLVASSDADLMWKWKSGPPAVTAELWGSAIG